MALSPCIPAVDLVMLLLRAIGEKNKTFALLTLRRRLSLRLFYVWKILNSSRDSNEGARTVGEEGRSARHVTPDLSYEGEGAGEAGRR